MGDGLWGSRPGLFSGAAGNSELDNSLSRAALGVIGCLAAALEKAMAPHSSTLAWKIPWLEEPGRLQSMGLLRVGHD